MSNSSPAVQHGLSEHGHGGDVPVQIRSERPSSTKVSDFPEITKRDEQWRYLDAESLKGLDALVIGELDETSVTISAAGATVEYVASTDSRVGSVGTPEDRTSASAWTNAAKTWIVTIAQDQKLVEPVFVTINPNSTIAQVPSAAHFVIDAKSHSEATIVIDHVGLGLLAENIETRIGAGANITLVSIQDWQAGSVHTSAQFAQLGRDSKLKQVVASFGGDLVRVTPSVKLTEPGSDIELLGVYLADSGQHLEHRPFVDHIAANCRSRVTFKGALQGEGAHTVWVGDVLIRESATGTDTYELNRNLLLTDGARADSVPNLEIETGQIEGAGHASASGRFDDEQLFYLQARGITEIEARRLVVRGFLHEIIQKIGVETIEQRLVAEIEASLSRKAL